MNKLFSLFGLPLLLSSFLPTMGLAYTGVGLSNVDADAVHFCGFNSGMYICSDETTDSSDVSTNDVTLPTDEHDVINFGFSEMFDGVALDITTDADGYDLGLPETSGGQYHFEYWDGSSWEDLQYTPGSLLTTTYDFANGDEGVLYKTWVRPNDWAMRIVNSSSSMYYVRMIVSDDYVSSALAGQAALIVYNLEVTVQDDFGSPITDMEESDFSITSSTADDTIYSFEEVEDGVYGFALDAPASTGSEYSLGIIPKGYVGKESARSDLDLDFIQYEYESEDHAFGHHLTATNEAEETVEIERAIAGTYGVECSIHTGEAYCAVNIADDNNSTATVWADGYVVSSGGITDREDDIDPQETDVIVLDYGYIATVTDEVGNVIPNATVEAGYGYGVNCTYLGTGRYGCAIPNANSDPLVRIIASGYETLESTFSTERNYNTDAQVTSIFRLTEGGASEEDEEESRVTDTDGDGLSDDDEADYGTDENDSDSDEDGIRDGAEVESGTDPLDGEDFLANGEDYYIDCSDPFTDTAENFAEKSVCILYDLGIVLGRSSTLYEPSATVTRAEFLKIALLNAGLTIVTDPSVSYTDIVSADWYYPYITYATTQGYVEGYDDGGFHPNDPINRAEAMVIMMRIANRASYEVTEEDVSFDDVDADDWFAYAVVEAAENGISEGYSDGTFKPGNDITRAEVAVIARRVWYVYFE